MPPNDAAPAGGSPPAAIQPAPASPATRAQRRRAAPIAVVLGLSLGAFVTLAISVELAMGYIGARRTAYELVRDRAVGTLDSLVEHIRYHLQPALDQVQFMVGRIETRALDPADEGRLAEALTYAMAAAPHVTSLAFVRPDLKATGVRRFGGRVEGYEFDLGLMRGGAAAFAETIESPGPYWGEVRYGSANELAVVNLRAPVRRDGAILGALAAAISIFDLSRILAEMSIDRTDRPFVLLGRNRVLAHPGNVFGVPLEQRLDMLLPSVKDFGDPVLEDLWHPAKSRLIERKGDIEARFVDAPGGRRVVVFRQVDSFGKDPWIVGTQFLASELGEEFERVNRVVYVGLAVLALAVAAAMMLGRRLSRPIHRLAEVADAIRHLDLDGLKPLPRSRISEIDRAARAFNAMMATMAWVETYLPRRLVKRLIRRQTGVESEEREVTVLFTDIVGFTRLSESKPARETAALLNQHFALVEKCIADEQGTLDKYMGDSAMAFWNAPEPQPDHALRACRAALAIAKAMREDARRRRQASQPVLRVRVGLHTGPVLVGNIGAPGRMDYTIVGDTVNTAQRLEKLGRRFDDGEAPVVVLASESTARAAGQAIRTAELGMRGLAGREKPITVYRLD
ncbi:MAG: adenylate/guanylate cyclase domain-containing protein [Rhodospirillales bacterium]